MTKLITYSSTGTKSASTTTLPKNLDTKKNLTLLAQAIRVYQDGKHPRTSSTKTRAEIKLSTRKIYRQKGTGGARHGAKSAPIFVGGSKAHGPKGLKKQLKLPVKMRRKALGVAVGIKANGKKLFVVSDVAKIKKTQQAASMIEKILKSNKVEKKNPKVTIALSEANSSTKLFFRNIKNVTIVPFRNLNALDVYYGGLILIDKESFAAKKSKPSKKNIKVKK